MNCHCQLEKHPVGDVEPVKFVMQYLTQAAVKQTLLHLFHGRAVPVILMAWCLRAARFLSKTLLLVLSLKFISPAYHSHPTLSALAQNQ